MDVSDFRERLASSKLESETLGVCLALTDVLSDIRPGDGHHLGLSFFHDRLGGKASFEKLVPALSILCTFDGAILEVNGYLDDSEEGQLHLSDEDFSDLLTTGRLAHPNSGELVENPLERVRIFYSLKGKE